MRMGCTVDFWGASRPLRSSRGSSSVHLLNRVIIPAARMAEQSNEGILLIRRYLT